ncbi:uncharacterized protein si:dkey-106l3.7 isoform X2 [Poeciliopsis prolifica]|uniref:uncharacterized protein si:dkey-106l3.7 isoform X2 n=1 Tax=Poeciliopsis prolifica TaxID=188132 RepID=UPI002413B060|nr:uncharacterized protein si:dkey-106l3.7 isoform X2 [Poeciliopsis prolifica]
MLRGVVKQQRNDLRDKAGTFSEMNLYTSFSNLMEAYVYEERTRPESQWRRDNTDGPHAPVSNIVVNPRSESVDSGVESATCETPNPATAGSVSTDNTEMDSFLRQSDNFAPASTPQPPVFLSTLSSSSSSSPNLRLSRAEEAPTTLNLKGEPELQRTDSKRWKQVYEVLSQQPKASSLPRQHTSELKRCIRSASFNLRRRFDPLVPNGQMSEMERKPFLVGSDKQISQSSVVEGKELSPGLCYLEWVCQKMELYAKHQMQNQAMQPQTDTPQKHKEQKHDAADAQADHPRLENAQEIPSEPQQQKPHHFRQRSASDSTFSKMHLKKFNLSSRVKRQSTSDLREIEEEDVLPMESVKEESSKKNIIQRLKLGSLRRVASAVSDSRSTQSQSSEKITTRRRLSQLFRRTRKVSPD